MRACRSLSFTLVSVGRYGLLVTASIDAVYFVRTHLSRLLGQLIARFPLPVFQFSECRL